MAQTTWKVAATAALFCLLLGLFFPQADDDFDRLNSVLIALLATEGQHSVRSKVKVAIGYGACQDLFVNGADLFSIKDSHRRGKHYGYIRSREELLNMYAYFFNHGAAAERYISNSSLFDELVEVARKMPRARFVLGGNAPVMAKRMAEEGCQVLLAAKMTPSLKEHLPSDIKVVGGIVEKDDIHLIIEYKTGETWGKHISPRANRFIVHSDHNNPTVSSLELFGERLQVYKPGLLIVGGLQMMDNFPFLPGQRLERLQKVRDQMKSQPQSTRVHFEMASLTDEGLFRELIDNVIYYADSLGMNEQELPNLHSMLLYQNISIVSDSNPRLAGVLDIMRDVYSALSKTDTKDGKRKLNRLHVHTLAYQAIMTTKGSPWKNSRSAAAKAALTANRHTCGSKQIDVRKARMIMDDSFATSRKEGSTRKFFQAKQPVSCWEEDLNDATTVEFCVAPVLVCTLVQQTAGAGDNISSAGLVLQV